MTETKTKILVDLDGTVCEPSGHYPEIGKPREDTIKKINQLKKNGHEVWIYTCREWWQEEEIKNWCKKNHLNIDGVICGKPLGIIIDDLAITPEETNPKTVQQKIDKLKEEWST